MVPFNSLFSFTTCCIEKGKVDFSLACTRTKWVSISMETIFYCCTQLARTFSLLHPAFPHNTFPVPFLFNYAAVRSQHFNLFHLFLISTDQSRNLLNRTILVFMQNWSLLWQVSPEADYIRCHCLYTTLTWRKWNLAEASYEFLFEDI